VCSNPNSQCRRNHGDAESEHRAGQYLTIKATRRVQPYPDAIVTSYKSQDAYDAEVFENRKADEEAASGLAASSPISARGFKQAADAETPKSFHSIDCPEMPGDGQKQDE
jgi:hypothetical protein